MQCWNLLFTYCLLVKISAIYVCVLIHPVLVIYFNDINCFIGCHLADLQVTREDSVSPGWKSQSIVCFHISIHLWIFNMFYKSLWMLGCRYLFLIEAAFRITNSYYCHSHSRCRMLKLFVISIFVFSYPSSKLSLSLSLSLSLVFFTFYLEERESGFAKR